jgi:hypothetical protein
MNNYFAISVRPLHVAYTANDTAQAAHVPHISLQVSPPIQRPRKCMWPQQLGVILVHPSEVFFMSFRGLHLLQLIFHLFLTPPPAAWLCLRALNDACGFNTTTWSPHLHFALSAVQMSVYLYRKAAQLPTFSSFGNDSKVNF